LLISKQSKGLLYVIPTKQNQMSGFGMNINGQMVCPPTIISCGTM